MQCSSACFVFVGQNRTASDDGPGPDVEPPKTRWLCFCEVVYHLLSCSV